MSALKEKIANLLKIFFDNKDTLDQNEFLELFHALKPEYDLDEEQVKEIFSMTDENNEGVVQKAQVERILNAVLASEGDEKKSFASNLGVDIRTSILPSFMEKGSFVSVLDDTEFVKQESNKPALRILHDLDLEKVNELKNIFNVCDSDNQGFTSVDQIKLLVYNIKKLSSSPEEIMELFEFIAEGEKRIISKETFYTLMNELEKNIRTFLYSEDNVPEYMARSGKSILRKTRAISRIDSEMYSNSEDEEYDEINELEEENTEMKLQIKLIIQKTENAIEGLRNKIKPTDVITMLTETVSILTILGNHLKDNGERLKSVKTQFNEQKNLLEMLSSKTGTLDFTLKNQEQTIEKLQLDNDKLNQQMLFANSELSMKEHLETELKEKNNEIVRLERKLNELQYDKDTFSKKLDTLENDNEILLESYKELESLYKRIEQEKKELETSLGSVSPQHEHKLLQGRESLMFESKILNDQKTNLEGEIEHLQSLLKELREQLGNNKEFVDALNLEKNDLQKKLQKMREEYANLNRESLFKRNSSMAGSPDRKRELRMALEQSVSKIKRGHARYASDTTALMGVLNKRISNQKSIGGGLRLIKEEEENILETQAENKKESEVRDSSSPKLEDAKVLAEKYLANFEKSPIQKANKPNVRKQLKFELQKASIDAPAPDNNIIRLSKVSNARKSEDLLTLLDKRKLFMDYLDLNKKAPILSMLKKYNETLEDKIFYSDSIYYINTNEQRQSAIIAITGEALYCLEPSKGYRVLRRTSLAHIYRITINQYSVGLLALHVHNDSDYLIDTYRRPKLIRFLKRVFQLKNLKQFNLYYEKSFLVQDKDPANAMHVSPYNKIMFNPELQAAYKNANKIGELYLREWSLFNRWSKYLFMLTNIGLFYFKEAGSLSPTGFIPIIDYLLINKKENASEDKHEFKIKFQYSNFSVTLAAESELEKLEWVTALHKVQESIETKVYEIEE